MYICQLIEKLQTEILQASQISQEKTEHYYATPFYNYIRSMTGYQIRVGTKLKKDFQMHFYEIIRLTRNLSSTLPDQFTPAESVNKFQKLHISSSVQKNQIVSAFIRALLNFYIALQAHYTTPATSEVSKGPGQASTHRIWVGKNPGKRKIISWAATNKVIEHNWFKRPMTHYLWTDNPMLLNLSESTPSLKYFKVKSIAELHSSTTENNFQVINRSLGLALSFIQWREFSFACDVLRHIVMYRFGGLYLDCTWFFPLFGAPVECPPPPRDTSIYFGSVNSEHNAKVLSKIPLGISSSKDNYLDFIKHEDSSFTNTKGKMKSSGSMLMYTGKSEHLLHLKTLQNMCNLMQHSYLLNIQKRIAEYRFSKHKKLIDCWSNNIPFEPRHQAMEFIQWLAQTPFEKALIDLEIYSVACSNEGLILSHQQPDELHMLIDSTRKYTYKSSIGIAKNWGLSWQKLDLKDLPYVEWP
ncbi:hypothetical protein [Pelagibaculum spongiae]|uniref:Uncharacterized protein n=1 Tax=Pelagibaculum spongiae TaxID=2080658 RepID=A0A2V1GT57_9GAMM|nr:hypothetical protein [Pelagibaculum spongiae]PVZ65701.1 hypothetical protein DC094_17630 [Pelagibaculum spongiae]